MFRRTIAMVVALVASGAGRGRVVADDSWYQPLEKKTQILEDQVRRWHWIDGLYPSAVDVPLDGAPVDHSTDGVSNVMHMVCWTANYVAGESYRYALLKKTGTPERVKAAREHVNAVFEGMHRCQKVTGIRGFQARGYLYGHGPTLEERTDSEMADYWYQGVGEYKDLRWRGSPSHHNYSDAIHGYGVFYRLAAEGEYKDRCRQAIDDLVSIWADNNLMLPTKDPNTPTFSILGLTDGKTPNLRVVMAAAGLKVAHFATGKEKFNQQYEKVVTQFGFRSRTTFPKSSPLDTDDGEHVFCHMDNLFAMEKDPKLLAFYRAVLEGMWAGHKQSKCPLFNYIYLSLTPSAIDRQKYLDDALWTLQSHPTNMHFQPRMNSLRDDIPKAGRLSKEPLPLFEATWDNEYMWKGHMYGLDGWLSRTVVALDAAREDPAVIYAAEEAGDLYRSRDAARTWTWIGLSPAPRALKLVCGGKRRHVFLATPSGAFRSVTGGEQWSRLPLPADSGELTDLQLDQTNPNRLYAVTRNGISRSIDFGEKWTGERWECLTPQVPPGHTVRLILAQGSPAMVYGQFDHDFRSKPLEGGSWSQPIQLSYREYVSMYPWLVVRPGRPADLMCGYRFEFRNLKEEGLFSGDIVGSLLSRSSDAGAHWTYDQPTVMKMLKEKGTVAVFAKLLSGLFPHFLEAITCDPRDVNTIYGATEKSFYITTDDGHTWKQMKDGLDIPKVKTIFTPAGDTIYAATPAGLYGLKRGEARWRFANLRLQFERNTQRDLGGAAYLDAYWMGRYFGFISDRQATEEPGKWAIPERYRSAIPKP
jgi:hypothetical protein